jgi:hypothetical protein
VESRVIKANIQDAEALGDDIVAEIHTRFHIGFAVLVTAYLPVQA